MVKITSNIQTSPQATLQPQLLRYNRAQMLNLRRSPEALGRLDPAVLHAIYETARNVLRPESAATGTGNRADPRWIPRQCKPMDPIHPDYRRPPGPAAYVYA